MREEEKAELNYRPPIAHMKTGLWALWFVFVTIMILWNQSETPTDPWFAWCGWLSFVGIALFGIAPLVISRDSPKIVSNKLGSTCASPLPVLDIPAQAAHPKYGVWCGGSVKAWFVYEFATSTRAYIIAPKDLVYVVGEEGKGLNVVVNCYLEVYTDHTQLPPHVLEALSGMKKPLYEPNMPILYGWWPLTENKLEEEDMLDYKAQFRGIGVAEEHIMDAIRIVTTASQKLTKFEYGAQLTDMESNLIRREKIVNSENQDLKKGNAYLKVELDDAYKRLTDWKEPQSPKSIFQLPSKRRDQDERENEYERRDREG